MMRFDAATLLLVIALAICAGRGLAQGGPPMISDDPDTPGDGKWENNIAAIVSTSPEGKTVQAPSVDLNYGYGKRIQLNYQAAMVSLVAPGQPRDTGLTQHVVGIKYRFIEPTSDQQGLSLSTYPKLGLRGPWSSANRDLTPDQAQWQLPLQLKMAFGGIAVTNEIGRAFAKTAPSSWFYGSVLGVSPTEHLSLMLEVHGDSDTAKRTNDWLINAGMRLEGSEAFDMIAALGHYLKTIGAAPQSLIYAGITLHR